jgi:hypothetical protein
MWLVAPILFCEVLVVRIQRKRTATIALGCLGFLFAAAAFGQSYTIQDIAAASKEKVVHLATMEDEFVVSLAELSGKADLVLDARLVRPRGYLSPDGMSISTDYEMVPSRFLRSQIGDISTSKTPRQQARLLLTVPGGQATVAGKTVISSFGMQKPINAGARYLIFATRVDSKDKRFVATAGSAGIFEVLDNGRLNPVLKTSAANPDFNEASFDDIARRVQSAPGRPR